MKKILPLLLVFALFWSMTSCKSKDNSDSDDEDKQVDTNQNDKDEDKKNWLESVTVEKAVIFEQDGFKVTVQSFEIDEFLGPALKVAIENKGTIDATVQVRELSINDLMVTSFFSCDVAAGKKANTEISISETDLKNSGITLIQKIEFKLHFFETESYDDLFDSEIITLTTSADQSYVQKYDDSGITALDDDNIRIVVKKIEKNEAFDETNVIVFIENKSNRNLTVQATNISLNGIMFDSIFSCDIASGKKAFAEISFLNSDLTENEVTEIETMELKFRIIDFADYDATYTSETVTVTFE